MSNIECPYCEKDNDWDYESDGEDNRLECAHCEKTFMYDVEFDPCFSCYRAPCLNGGEHEWRDIIGAEEMAAAKLKTWRRCRVCREQECVKLEEQKNG